MATFISITPLFNMHENMETIMQKAEVSLESLDTGHIQNMRAVSCTTGLRIWTPSRRTIPIFKETKLSTSLCCCAKKNGDSRCWTCSKPHCLNEYTLPHHCVKDTYSIQQDNNHIQRCPMEYTVPEVPRCTL